MFQFSSVLFSLLDRISQLGRDNYNEKVLNVLHRYERDSSVFAFLFTSDWTSMGSTQQPSINSRRTLDNLDTFDNLDLKNWITKLFVRMLRNH